MDLGGGLHPVWRVCARRSATLSAAERVARGLLPPLRRLERRRSGRAGSRRIGLWSVSVVGSSLSRCLLLLLFIGFSRKGGDPGVPCSFFPAPCFRVATGAGVPHCRRVVGVIPWGFGADLCAPGRALCRVVQAAAPPEGVVGPVVFGWVCRVADRVVGLAGGCAAWWAEGGWQEVAAWFVGSTGVVGRPWTGVTPVGLMGGLW